MESWFSILALIAAGIFGVGTLVAVILRTLSDDPDSRRVDSIAAAYLFTVTAAAVTGYVLLTTP